MKSQMSIDPNLIPLVGQKLYSMHPVVICVRELLQNAVDACKRAGVNPEITITIDTPTKGLTRVTCEDNGVGMTEEELVNKFLCLGGTNKVEGETGGFGIAKAALMSGIDWKVCTLDHYTDWHDLLAGEEIQKVPHRIGTLVEATYATTVSVNIKHVVEMVYGSDVDIHLVVDVKEDWLEPIDDPHAGLHSPITLMVSGENWTGGASETLQIYDGWTSWEKREMKGGSFIRLNGLVQFLESRSNYRANNLFVEVYTNERPSSKEYPFTLSRERLVGDLEHEIGEWIDLQNENPLSSDQDTQKLEPEDIGVVPGHLLMGKRTTYSKHSENSEMDLSRNVIDTVSQLKNNLPSNRKDLQPFIHPNSDSLMIKLVNYNPEERNVERDAKLVTAWGEILREIIDLNTEFGVGLIGRHGTISTIDRNNGVLFFCMNPDHYGNEKTTLGKVLSMWGSGCHEVAHVFEQRHNERLTGIMAELRVLSADAIGENLKRISKILEGLEEV